MGRAKDRLRDKYALCLQTIRSLNTITAENDDWRPLSQLIFTQSSRLSRYNFNRNVLFHSNEKRPYAI